SVWRTSSLIWRNERRSAEKLPSMPHTPHGANAHSLGSRSTSCWIPKASRLHWWACVPRSMSWITWPVLKRHRWRQRSAIHRRTTSPFSRSATPVRVTKNRGQGERLPSVTHRGQEAEQTRVPEGHQEPWFVLLPWCYCP